MEKDEKSKFPISNEQLRFFSLYNMLLFTSKSKFIWKVAKSVRLLNKHEFKFDTSTVPLVHVYLTLLCNILCNILSSICLFLSKGHHTQISNVSKVKGKEGKRPDLEKMRSKTTRIKKLTTTILT